MTRRSSGMRNFVNFAAKVVATSCAFLGIIFLGWVLIEVVQNGMHALNWSFFTQLPPPPGSEEGGLANAILGTLELTGLATLIAVPLGLLAGIYLSEFGQKSILGAAARFVTNCLIGIPSIIVGLFVYASMVVPMGKFSGYAGAVSLAVIMFPVVVGTSEAMLNLVPNELRESAIAIGAPRWKITLQVVFAAAKAGIVTGIILSIARVSGETAPLLFTALNSPYWPSQFAAPTANLTVTIFNYAMSPYAYWQQLAWGASLLIMIAVLALTIAARTAFRESQR
ncbi:MAG: phosphate ABC transporter permease PstA [Desulfomonilaceae bacterium]